MEASGPWKGLAISFEFHDSLFDKFSYLFVCSYAGSNIDKAREDAARKALSVVYNPKELEILKRASELLL